jgi:hypothetical protein
LVAANSPGNVITIQYTADTAVWASGGQIKVTVPSGWPAPTNSNTNAQGYYTVAVAGGSKIVDYTSGQDIVVVMSGLTPGGTITVTYGATSGSGPGITAPSSTGFASFSISTQPNPGTDLLLALSGGSPFQTDVEAPTPTVTPTITPTFSDSPTSSATFTITQTHTVSPTFTITPTFSDTYTVTPTNTPIRGEGSASISPAGVITGSSGNIMIITYTSGADAWADSPGYGSIKITIPAGWTAPQYNTPNAAGYFTVAIAGGTEMSRSVSGQVITLKVYSLPAGTGTITVTYGDKTFGSPGAAAQGTAGNPVFEVDTTTSGDTVYPINVLPSVSVVDPTRTSTPTYSVTVTDTPTFTPTFSVTPTITITNTYTYTPTYSATMTYSPTFTDTPTFTPTYTATPTNTPLRGEGGAVISPLTVAAGTTGNTVVITYTNGPDAWATGGNNGIIRFVIPAGWSAPSFNSANPGYFDVNITGGTDAGRAINGQTIKISVDGLLPGGTVVLTYGASTGAVSQGSVGSALFGVETSSDNSANENTYPINGSPLPVNVVDATQTSTVTPTDTPTFTSTITPTITGTYTATPSVTQTVTQTITQTITRTATQTITGTYTPTFTGTVTPTITGTWTYSDTPTYTMTPTFTATPSITPTGTPVIGEGSASVSPLTVVAGDSGYTVTIDFTPGPTVWSNGQMEITIPAGWSAPNKSVTNAPGYYTLNITNGTEITDYVVAGKIVIVFSSLQTNGSVEVVYGSKTGGGTGATAQPAPGTAVFLIKTDPLGSNVHEILSSPQINVTAPTPTFTITPTYTPTYTVTMTVTPTITGTVTPTITQTITPTDTQTITQTITETVTRTITGTITPTVTGTVTPTVTGTDTPTDTQTITRTITQTVTQTITATITPTDTQTITQTITQTVTPTVTQTITRTITETVTPTITGTVTPTVTETATPTATLTTTPTDTQTATQTVTGTDTQTITQTITQTVTETVTPTVTRTITGTITETVTPTATGTVTPTDTQTVTPTVTGTDTPTDTQTITQTITETDTQTVTRTITETITQTVTPTITGTTTPTVTETATPSITGTVTPTDTQTVTPTITGTDTPTDTQTITQTITETDTQTVTRTITETITQTVTPTITGTTTPTVTETATPSITGTVTPTDTQTVTPTITGTDTPTDTHTITQTITETDTQTVTRTITETITQTVTPTITGTTTPTVTETATPSITGTVTPTDTQTVTPTVTGTDTPTDTQTITQTVTETVTRTITATITQTVTETVTPTITPSTTPTDTQTITETTTRTITGTVTPTVTGTITQTITETVTPTVTGTSTPSITMTYTMTLTVTATVTTTVTETITRTVTETITDTITTTFTITPTFTPVIGEGSASITPNQAAEGTNGNTFVIDYTNGAVPWEGTGPDHGTLVVQIPAGWTPPSDVPSAAGYVDITGAGIIANVDITGQTITIYFKNLAAFGMIHVTYGSKSSGGSGVQVPLGTGPVTFVVQSDPDSSDSSGVDPYPILNSPVVNVVVPTQTVTPTATETSTPTITQTATPSITETVTQTVTQTVTRTATETATQTVTGTATPSITETTTQTITATATPTVTGTATPSVTQTQTQTFTVTMTVTQTVTGTVTETATQTVTPTATQTITETATQTVTSTITPTVTQTVTQTITGTVTGTITRTVTETFTPVATDTDTATATATQSITPTATGTSTPTVTQTVTETITQTATQTATGTVTQTATETATQTITGTVTPTITGSATPTITETATQTITGTITQTITQTVTRTITQTTTQSITATVTPTCTNTPSFTSTYTATQTATPTVTPTSTDTPAASATDSPTFTVTPTYTQTQTNTPTFTITMTATMTASPTSSYTPTFTGTPTSTPTYTVTPTFTKAAGEGLCAVSPSNFISGNGGYAVTITYTAGTHTWDADPNYGTLRVTVPDGWTPPDANTIGGPGYFTVTVIGGTVVSQGTDGMAILVQVSGLTANTGEIIINYSRVTAGPPGTAVFKTEMAFSGDIVAGIQDNPAVTVVAPTPTITPTNTPVMGEGTAAIAPGTVAAGIPGYQMSITYTSGAAAWAAGSNYGTIDITIPAGWTAPNANPGNAGYFSVAVSTGSIFLKGTAPGDPMTIRVRVKGLLPYSTISVIYGDVSGGGNVTPQSIPGIAPFIIKVDTTNLDGLVTYPIFVQPDVNVIVPTPTVTPTITTTLTYTPTYTVTVTFTVTPTETETDTGTITPTWSVSETSTTSPTWTISETPTVTETVTDTPSQTVTPTYSVTETITETVTETATQTVTQTATQTATRTITQTVTQTATGTVTQTVTGTVTPTVTQTITETATQTVTETITQTVTQTDTQTATETITQTVTQTATETITQTITLTATSTVTQTVTRTATQTVTQTITETATQTVTETVTQTDTATFTVTVTDSATYTVTQTDTPTFTQTPTFTVTPTNTPIIGEGSAVIVPGTAAAGTTGNTLHIIYTAGPSAWTTGTIRITVPAGWSAPSANLTDPGYFSASSSGGSSSVDGTAVIGNDMIITVSNLPGSSGTVTIVYGDKTFGSPGAASQPGLGTAVFDVMTDNTGVNVHNILVQPVVIMTAPTPTATSSPTSTATPTVTMTATPIIGEGTATAAPGTVTAGSAGNTMIITYTSGVHAWASSPDYGSIRITIPAGWPAPNSVNNLASGFFTVTASSGSNMNALAVGQAIIISVQSLSPGSTITVKYGDMSQGGPGAGAQPLPGTADFLVESTTLGNVTYPIMMSPQVIVVAATPTSTSTPTLTITQTSTASPTYTVTETSTETFTITVTSTPTYTATPTYTQASTPVKPSGLSAYQNGTSTTLQWGTDPNVDSYSIYSASGASGKFNAFPSGWAIIATVIPTPVTSSYTYTDVSGEAYRYYLVTGRNAAGESGTSSMAAKAQLAFDFTGASRISLPYSSKFTNAASIVTDIEGSILTENYIDQLMLWNPFTQSYFVYLYSASSTKWKGANWPVDSGTTSSNAISLNVKSAFTWTVAGTDVSTPLYFYLNSGLPNGNKRSIPYTSAYGKASDVVTDIEGNTYTAAKISQIMLWVPSTQSYVVRLFNGIKWKGPDFSIAPGDMLYFITNQEFTWTPKLVVTPVP